MSGSRPVRIGVIGNAGLDVSGRLSDAAKLAALIRSTGAVTAFAGLVDDGPKGNEIKRLLQEANVETSRVAISPSSAIALGDQIDIAGLFAMDALVIAVSDFRLHRFLVDLPTHTAPNARLIGLLPHLAAHPTGAALDVTLLHDLVIATDDEIGRLTHMEDRTEAIREIQRRMVGANLRSAAVFRPGDDSVIVTKTERGGGKATDFDAFVARAAVVFARRSDWSDVFRAESDA